MVVRIGQKLTTPYAKTYFKEWREFRGLKQEELAELMGTGKSAVSKLENGKTQYNASNLRAWSKALQCKPIDFFRLPTDPDINGSYERAHPEVQRIVRRALDLDD